MFAVRLLSSFAIAFTLAGVALLTWLDVNAGVFDVIGRLNEVNAPQQALANGLFLIAGVFWVGAVDTTRRTLEPVKMDSVLRFSVIAFAASYILRMVFPCDVGCPAGGSVSQWLQTTFVWLLYSGPAVFAVQLWRQTESTMTRQFASLVLLVFVVMQLDNFFLQIAPGVWQRVYELLFCWLWWQYTASVVKSD